MVKKPAQKLVSFSEDPGEISAIEQDLHDGWNVVSIMPSGNNYLCVLEKDEVSDNDNSTVYIPPRKKLKIKIRP